jgi:hypothetical protein
MVDGAKRGSEKYGAFGKGRSEQASISSFG